MHRALRPRTARTRAALCAAAILLPLPALAAPPSGSLDAAQPTLVGGWARDPDYPGPIPVHIYIDGQIAHAVLADAVRSDLPFADQAHGFTWTPPFLGPGAHTIAVYPIGVDASGVPDGENPPLPNSPVTFTGDCSAAAGTMRLWCDGVPNYYAQRTTDTRYLFNDNLRAGINTSYGGTVFELYPRDHSTNLILEHGGGAMQLSVWGYDPVGPGAFFGQGPGVCDPVPYDTESACLAQHASCRAWGASRGAHVANCTTVLTCVDWGAGAPFNPIQAQANDCGWDSPANDADTVRVDPAGTSVYTLHGDPYHFTKSNNFPGMAFEQTASLMTAGVCMDYRITYSGPFQLTPHPQEIPALFPAAGINHTYYFYDGAAPYTDATSPVNAVVAPTATHRFWLPGHPPASPTADDTLLSEHWVSVCDAASARCVTVATFRDPVDHFAAAAYDEANGGYLTPTGTFSIGTGLDVGWSVYVFPYRYDETVAGRTIRAWVHSLASDPTQCGRCGQSCAAGEACVAGECVSPGVDAGEVVDAREVVDAGGMDASTQDAMVSREAGGDASGDGAVDAGQHGARGGCGCRAVGGSARGTGAALWLALIAATARRRRWPSPPRGS